MIVARLVISIALLLILSVASPASRTVDSLSASAREVFASQPDFAAELIASDVSGAKRHMRLAKKGSLFRLDYSDGTPTVFVDQRFSLWELDPGTATASPEGTVPMIVLHAPWLLFAVAAEHECVAFIETRDGHGELVSIEVRVPSEDDSPMLCSVDRHGLVTRVEYPGYEQGQLGYRLYELKNVSYNVPSSLFSVPLDPQSSDYKDELCPHTDAT